MKALEERILRDGKTLGTEIVKVDSFINHQVDTLISRDIGIEFARLFKDSGANKILTIESSGIIFAYSAAVAMGGLPLVFAKKARPSTLSEDFYETDIRSFTKGTVSKVIVSKEFLLPEDKVLIIDDFLASGEAGMGLLDLCRKAGAECVGFGACIEKKHQGGAERLRAEGVRVESLAVIASISDGNIEFER